MTRILLCLIVSCACALAQQPNHDDMSAGIALGGADVLAIVKDAKEVTVQRVDSVPIEQRQHNDDHPQVITMGEPFPAPAEQATELKRIFCSGKTYISPSKTCQFRANVRYGFVTPTDKVEVILCFGCGEMEIWRGNKLVSFGPFDGGYGELLAVTKKLFPDDRFFDGFSVAKFRERAAQMQAAPSPTVKP